MSVMSMLMVRETETLGVVDSYADVDVDVYLVSVLEEEAGQRQTQALGWMIVGAVNVSLSGWYGLVQSQRTCWKSFWVDTRISYGGVELDLSRLKKKIISNHEKDNNKVKTQKRKKIPKEKSNQGQYVMKRQHHGILNKATIYMTSVRRVPELKFDLVADRCRLRLCPPLSSRSSIGNSSECPSASIGPPSRFLNTDARRP